MKKALLTNMPSDLRKPEFERFTVKPVNYFREAIQTPESSAEKPVSRSARVGSAQGIDLKAAAEQIARAREEGIREGVERGRSEALVELGQAIQLLAESAKLFHAERDEAASRFQSQLVSLATEMTKKILDAELSVKPELLLSIVQAAMNSARDANQVTLRIHPDDHVMIKDHHDALKQSLGSGVSLDFKPDSNVGRGGCIIDTELGSLDARLSTQLETLRSQLDERIGATK